MMRPKVSHPITGLDWVSERKRGKGFYTYPDPEYLSPEFLIPEAYRFYSPLHVTLSPDSKSFKVKRINFFPLR